MLMAGICPLWADAVTFEATVNAPQVSLDEIMQLTLSVTGVNNDLDPVSLPVIDGFSAKYVGPSTSVSIINGDYHSERSFIYDLFPNRVGKFQIPSISATIAGQTYTTKPIDVEVLASSAQASAPAQASSGTAVQNQAPSEESLKDKILVKVLFDKTDVYLNESIPVTIKLLVNDVPVRDIQYPQFDKSGITVDDFEKPLQNSEVVDGVRYDTVVFKTNIYPDRSGDLTFGPVQIQGNVLYKTGQQNPFDQANNIFGADVFNNFFDSYASRPITAASDPVQLHVSSLPSDGRPDDFSGAIGRSFDFHASVSPSQVKAGDPLTLKMDVKGSGNLKNLKMPEFQEPGFKTYAPQIKNGEGDKSVEQVIIPISAGAKQVPALRFSYFDTDTNSYKTITQGPFSVQVTAPNPDQEFKAIGFSDVSKQGPALLTDQFSFGKIFRKTGRFFKGLFRSVWFWSSAGGILAVGIAFVWWRGFQERLDNDPAFARKLKALKEARQVLALAEKQISTGTSKDFYALLSKSLRDYLANKLDRSKAALSVNDISNHLKTIPLDEAHITQLATLLEQSDLVCFAGAAVGPDKMRADLTQAQGLVTYLERSLK